jgi:hypothetical protein
MKITPRLWENQRMSRRAALISGVLLITLATILTNAAQSTPWWSDRIRPFTVAETINFRDGDDRIQLSLLLKNRVARIVTSCRHDLQPDTPSR